MRLFLFIIFSSVISAPVYSYNKGLSCITYISKKGTVNLADDNKFPFSSIYTVLEHYRKNSPDVTIREGDASRYGPFLKGLTDEQGLYPIIRIGVDDIRYQNGIFYIPRSQDWASMAIGDLETVLNGKMNVLCKPTGER